MSELKYHAAAQLFPDMAQDEFAALVESVREHGLREPVVLLDGVILDGRHRARACEQAGVELKIRQATAEERKSPIQFVLDANLKRRHLTPSQKACIGAEAVTLFEKEARERKRAGQKSGGRGKKKTSPSKEGKVSGGNHSGESTARAAAAVGGSRSCVERAKKLKDQAPDLFAQVKAGEMKVTKAERVAAERAVQAAVVPTEDAISHTEFTLALWNKLRAAQRRHVLTRPYSSKATFNRHKDDPDKTASIEWARWSWNPVTGCKHNCSYCYARDVANNHYAQRFEPTLLAERLSAPANTVVPAGADKDIGLRNVFTCSMADLFGKWVPAQWIEAVLDSVRGNPQWNFLFLTKFPRRLVEFEFPENAWIGTTVDAQARVAHAEEVFAKVRPSVCWLSLEPLLEPLHFNHLDLFHWIVIGGASRSLQTPEWRPPLEWIVDLERQAKEAGCRVYHKANLFGRRLEYPGGPMPEPLNVADAFRMGYLQRDVLEPRQYANEMETGGA